MIEAVSTSETSVNFDQTTRRNIPEDDQHVTNNTMKNVTKRLNHKNRLEARKLVSDTIMALPTANV
jgi:hypothetical protein